MQADQAFMTTLTAKMGQMEKARQPYFSFWQEISQYFLPRRYVWLEGDNTGARVTSMRNSKILDSTGTQAAKILASGMMNGITSPARPWFSLSISGRDDLEKDSAVQIWLDEVTRRMMLVMSESNFYNALAVMYLDLVVFGTSAMLVYEDYDSVIRCFNPALGEYFLAQDYRLSVNTFGRRFQYTIQQAGDKWGVENLSERAAQAYKKGGGDAQQPIDIYHLIEPNNDNKGKISDKFKFRETYWEKGCSEYILEQSGFHELPGLFPRWELTANDSYGACPAMEAIGDVKQLQQETLRKAQGLDKLVSPPMLADIQLQNKPTALLPNGVTYVAGVNNIGIKPAYQIAVPFGELTQDIMAIQNRIRQTFYNDLFQMISNLDTVRSATEIDARREEKLVLLGPVLERFENEALDPAITRIYSIMDRAKLLPPPPPAIAEADIQIQYISILSTAQRALGAAPIERWMQFTGNLAAVRPDVLNIPNFEEVIRHYGKTLGVPEKLLNAPEISAAATAAQNQAKNQQAMMQQSTELTGAAKQLSDTDVGGGSNALQQILGG